MPRNKEKEDRNPFLILLLQKLFKSEAEIVFGKYENLEDGPLVRYLSIPRNSNQMTIWDIRHYRFRKKFFQEHCETIARGNVHNVIKYKNRSSFTDEMINNVVKRLTFYGKFDSYAQFAKHYSKWAKKFEKYNGVPLKDIPVEDREKISNDLYEVYKAENAYIKQNGILTTGKIKRPSIRLKDCYFIQQIESTALGGLRGLKSYLNDSRESTRLMQSYTRFSIIDGNLVTVGFVELIPGVLYDGRIFKKGRDFTMHFKATRHDPTDIYVSDISAKNRKVFETLLFNLSEIISLSIGKKLPNICSVLIFAEKEKFGPFAMMLDFKEWMVRKNDPYVEAMIIDYEKLKVFHPSRVYHIDFRYLKERSKVDKLGSEKY